ncbi:MAG: hypothetical protein QOF36_852 [Microbacteriaceae bacterium]|nr:hypothetical protein [Microbacteriaceae bacterium]
MSNITPESPKNEPNVEPERVTDPDAGEPTTDTDQTVTPPSEPVRASGHVSAPEPTTPQYAAPTTGQHAAATPSEVDAAVARSNAEPVPAERPVTDVYEAPTAAAPAWSPEPPATVAPAAEPTTTVEPATTVEPTATAAPTAAYGQPPAHVYVPAPLPPKKKSNRGIGILIALVGTVIFAVVYAIVIAIIGGILLASPSTFLTQFTQYLTTASFYVPVIAFAVAMIVLVQIVNRAGWWVYIIGGLFVAVIVYFAFVGGTLLAQGAWNLTPQEAARFIGTLWLNPFAIAAGIVAREVSLWTGLWLAARGRRLKARNAEAREEYERSLDAASAQNGYPNYPGYPNGN